ncbi:Pentatricopeptide repeat-containing protein [Apostasia shenzhenica]|uniref:Pentatricopeptide repeat-containing protein n=1 Tax=Apostasia shenzhenica TaxID=1088818 RepID=A0A2H9ZTF4_9ASPA|nr:Pentatricopeptide repeat-containing protein [Apostasia shenzhenica]
MGLLQTFATSPAVWERPAGRFSLKVKRNKNKNLRPDLRRSPEDSVALSFPKPSPTPLLISSSPSSENRDEALDRILLDLHSTLARGVRVDASTFSSLLELCFRAGPCHRRVVFLNRLIPVSLLRSSVDLSSKLIRLYASCGLVEKAHHLFDVFPRRHKSSAFPWNALISGYAEVALYEDAMALYHQMEEEGIEPDSFTFPRVLKACAGVGSLPHGEAVHRHLVRSGFAGDHFALNALVDMYAKCGDIARARGVFDKLAGGGDPVAWNSMLNGYVRHALFPEAIHTFRRMLAARVEPDTVTVSSIISACARAKTIKLSLELHAWVLRRGLDRLLSVANSLISLYSELGRSSLARCIFYSMPEKDLVSWNAIIAAHRRDRRVIAVFRQMEDSGVSPDHITFVSLLSACANLGLVEDGRKVFDKMTEKYGIRRGVEHYSCMVKLLGMAGLVEEAFELVEKTMPFNGGPTVWGALLSACSVQGNAIIGEVAAERLFELEPENGHNFELLRKIYRDAGRMGDEERVGKMMRERGL